MPESQLPPVYIPKETNKRLKLDNTIGMYWSPHNTPFQCYIRRQLELVLVSYFHLQPVSKKFVRKKVSIFRALFSIVRRLQSLNCVVNSFYRNSKVLLLVAPKVQPFTEPLMLWEPVVYYHKLMSCHHKRSNLRNCF